MSRVAFLVVAPGPIVMGGYWNDKTADIHARTITGAWVIAFEMFDTLPESVRDDLQIDMEWDENDEDTPVITIPVRRK